MPYRLLKAFHKVQQRLVRELEKKFSGKDVVLIANRRVMPTPSLRKFHRPPALAHPHSGAFIGLCMQLRHCMLLFWASV